MSGTGRVSYIVAGQAIRQAHGRARAASCSAAERDVVAAVVELVATYSRLADRVSLERVAAAAGRHPKTTGRALRHLAQLGVLVYQPGRGRARVSLVGLPTPEKGTPGDSLFSEPPAPERAEPPAEERVVDADAPESFLEAIDGLVPTSAQRSEWLKAYHESASGFLRCVEEAKREGRNPTALLTDKLRRGEHRGRGGSRRVTSAEVMAQAEAARAEESAS